MGTEYDEVRSIGLLWVVVSRGIQLQVIGLLHSGTALVLNS